MCNVVQTLKIITQSTLPNNPKVLYNILKNVILLMYFEIVLHRLTFMMDSTIINMRRRSIIHRAPKTLKNYHTIFNYTNFTILRLRL